MKSVATFYCYLWWEYEETDQLVIRAVVSVWAENADLRKSLLGPLKRAAGSKIKDDGGEIWLGEEVAPNEFADFDKKLDRLLSEWIRLWKKIGGLKPYLKIGGRIA